MEPDREAEPQFSQPVNQIVLMVAVLVLVGAGTGLAFATIFPVIEANLWLNGFIIFVFGIGVIACFLQV
ncbi:MAG: biopolymer transporter ExbB, partial [Pseudomonadota bacterium]